MEVNLCLLESRVSYQSTESSRAHFLQVFGDGGVILHKIVEAQGFPLDLNVGSEENSKVNILIRYRIKQTANF